MKTRMRLQISNLDPLGFDIKLVCIALFITPIYIRLSNTVNAASLIAIEKMK